jgi:hypothetical protein
MAVHVSAPTAGVAERRTPRAAAVAACAAILALGSFYYVAAERHASTVNTFKARGDQSAYLAESKLIYFNWTGANSPPIVQPRNRMPLYPALLALFYDPAWSDDEFFVHARQQSIVLSMVWLAAISALAFAMLPRLLAANFLLVVAFGYYVFKAGYVQSELLYYTLHFFTFVVMMRLLKTRSPRATLILAVSLGVLAALAHLTKASLLPLLGIFVAVFVGRQIALLIGTRRQATFASVATFATALGCLTLALLLFIAILAPYLSTSKRVHGQYFYNLNTAVLIWYDNWPQASVAIRDYGPDGWPKGPRRLRPGPLRYWNEHTTGQIASRFAAGFRDMVVRSYHTFWYFKYLVLYSLIAGLLLATSRGSLALLWRRHAAAAVFCSLYAAVYLPAIAFYEPTSGTGTTRFLLAHAAPFLFAVSLLFAEQPFRDRQWRCGDVTVTMRHLQLLVTVIVATDLVFTFWPRLMGTYGGF